MIRKILGLIFNRWTLAILGLAAVSLIIWYVGPLIAIAEHRPLESAVVRWVLIGLVIAIYFGRIVWKFLRAKVANTRLFDSLLKQTPPTVQPEAGAEEVALLRQRFDEAVGVLKQSRLGSKEKKSPLAFLSRRQYVYELPWYIIIGAPGSGKTTALINSGLKFSLSERFGDAAIRGVGGTRNCDWWFTDEAVLLDTAGRYTTQESDREADSAAWSGFLQLLKKFRPRRPINGVLVAISVADLLQQSAGERADHAKALRQRVQELHQQLGIRFPVYVLITKADLLAGFMEFFANFGAEERAQVWGVSFPFVEPMPDNPLAGFRAEFASLDQRLHDRLIDRLQEERDPQRRGLLYAFPQQFASLKEGLSDFLDQVFAPSRFEEKPLLRGVYFTSGTQEGNPIDRVMGVLGRAFRLERKLLAPQKPSGKSFFITRLLRQVIFAEAGLAGTNLKWERRRTVLQWGGLALAGIVTLGSILAWSVSYSRNKGYVGEVQAKLPGVAKQVESFPGSGDDVVSLLPALQSVRDLARTPAVADSTPISMGFGLYQGNKLEAAADDAYHRLLRDAFLPRLGLRIEELLRTNQNKPEALYEILKAYLMLNDPEHFDATAFKTFVKVDWDENLPRDITVEQRQALDAHLDALLDRGQLISPLVPDAQLIASARSAILQTPIERRVYNRLRREGIGSQFPEFTIANVVGANAGLVFRRASGKPLTSGVPGLFSYNGYYKAFVKTADETTRQLANEESWVLGVAQNQRPSLTAPGGKAALFDEVRRLYLEDYANTWDAFVKDIRVEMGNNRRQMIQAASILSGPTSPLPVLLRAIVHEVTLVKKSDAEKSLIEKGEDQVKQQANWLRKLMGSEQPKSALQLASQPESIVDNRFDDLRSLVTPTVAGQPAPIDGELALLKELSQAMITAGAAIDANTPPPPSDAPNKALLEANQSPEPLRTILQSLGDAAAKLIGLGMKANISGELTQLAEFCNKATAGRYPFVRSASRDVTQDDFARLFAPGGEFDRFFQAKLLPIVDTSTRPWTYRQVGDARQGDTSGALVQFQRAQTIRDVFFRNGSTPAIHLEFKPVEMDVSITQFILDVDGQIVKYAHGPQVPQPVQWPGPRGSMQVRLQITPPPTSAGGLGPFEGPWALFRMFDRVRITPSGQPEKFNTTFVIDGRKARFEVLTSSVENPFRLKDLEQFRCPNRL